MSVQVIGNSPDEENDTAQDASGLSSLSLDPANLLTMAGSLDLFSADTVDTAMRQVKNGHAWRDVTQNVGLLGAPASELTREQCYLIMIVLDDSGSMQGYEEAVITAANSVIRDYKEAKNSGDISSDVLIGIGTLNRGLIYPYTMIQNAKLLTSADYHATGNTPLYNVANSACALQMTKTAELITNAVTSKTITLFMTDGHNTESGVSASDIHKVVSGIREKDRSHIVGGVYLGDADKSTFAEMGIPDEWILSGKGSAANLISAFSRFSKMSRGSKTAAANTPDQEPAKVVIS